MERAYKVGPHNSTVDGYPGYDYDWAKFCWDGSALLQSILKERSTIQAPLPWVDDGFIGPNCQYLHVPYAWAEIGTIYRVRPNENMRAGGVYRGYLVTRQRAEKREDGFWYWILVLEENYVSI